MLETLVTLAAASIRTYVEVVRDFGNLASRTHVVVVGDLSNASIENVHGVSWGKDATVIL